MNSSDWNNSSNNGFKGWNNFANGITTDVQSTESRLKELEKKFNTLEKKVENMSHNISRKKYSEITHVNITCNNCQKKI